MPRLLAGKFRFFTIRFGASLYHAIVVGERGVIGKMPKSLSKRGCVNSIV